MTAWLAMFIVLALLQVADVVITLRNIRAGAVEVNPVIAAWMGLLGPVGGLVVPKVAIMAAMWIFVVPAFALGALCVLYGWLAMQRFRVG